MENNLFLREIEGEEDRSAEQSENVPFPKSVRKKKYFVVLSLPSVFRATKYKERRQQELLSKHGRRKVHNRPVIMSQVSAQGNII